MIIFKMFKNHIFFNIFGPFFCPKSGFKEEKMVTTKWHGPLAIKTKLSQIIYLFLNFFSQKAQTFSRGIFLFFLEHPRAKKSKKKI